MKSFASRASVLIPAVLITTLCMTACDPDPVPPANDPFAKLLVGPDLVPNGKFDYDYKVTYDWGANPERAFHVIVEHTCEMQSRIGTNNPVRSRMHLAEFWPLDERGMLPPGIADQINRKTNATIEYAEAHECCNYTIYGIQRTSGKDSIPSGPTSVALGAIGHQGAPVRELTTAVVLQGGNGPVQSANVNQNHYYRFRQNKGVIPRSFKFKLLQPPKQSTWMTEYNHNAEGFKMVNVSGGRDVGDQRPLRGCDFGWP